MSHALLDSCSAAAPASRPPRSRAARRAVLGLALLGTAAGCAMSSDDAALLRGNDGAEIGRSPGAHVAAAATLTKPEIIVVTNTANGWGTISVFAGDASGNVAPLRTIAGSSTTLQFPSGVFVVRDEIFVCDGMTGAIDVFPLTADGDVPPTRQIIGPSTGVHDCFDVAVLGDKLYVSNLDSLLVFPRAASGNVPPVRKTTWLQAGAYLSIDQDDIYVADASGDAVLVFPLLFADQEAPSRILPSHCPAGVIARDGELLVSDPCSQHITTYPEGANGATSPLRSLFAYSTQMRRFGAELYTTDFAHDRIEVYAATATGGDAPVRSIAGFDTGLGSPHGLFVR